MKQIDAKTIHAVRHKRQRGHDLQLGKPMRKLRDLTSIGVLYKLIWRMLASRYVGVYLVTIFQGMKSGIKNLE